MSVLDEYLVDPKLSLLDKTRIQAQVLVPVLRALRAELGKAKADAIVKQALRDCRNSCLRPSAAASMVARAANGRLCIRPWPKLPSTKLRWICCAMIRKRWNSI